MGLASHFLLLLCTFFLVHDARQAFLEGNEPPDLIFTKEPAPEVRFSNNSGENIDCRATGSTPTSVNWLFADGSAVTNISGLRQVYHDGTLVFLPFSSEAFRQDVHSVFYKCQGSNAAGSIISRDVKVKAVMDVEYAANVYDVFAIRGNTAAIKCHIPTFLNDFVSVVAFIRDDSLKISTMLNKDDKFYLAPHGTLYVKDVRTTDAGTSYKCQTYHHLTGKIQISSSSGKLFVTDPHGNIPPRIVDTIPSKTANIGDSVLLPCVSHGYPIPESRWTLLHNENAATNVQISQTGRIRVTTIGLSIQAIQLSDAGNYICKINNSIGVDQMKIILHVTAPLKVSVLPEQQTVNLGSPFSLKCNISGYPIKSAFWTKNGLTVSSPLYKINNNHISLEMDSISFDDRGMYQCFVQNDDDRAQAVAQVNLGEFPPVLRETFKEEVVQPGSSVDLTCRGTGNPLPQITWSLDNMIVETSLRLVIDTRTTADNQIMSTLSIKKARVEDGGVYTCNAFSTLGSRSYNARINVYGPLFIRQTPRLNLVSGSTSQLNCPFYGYPLEAITWEKDSFQLPMDLRQDLFSNGTLTIQNVNKNQDNGEYRCTITNKQGQSATGSIQVAVIVLPKITPFAFQDELIREGLRARIQCTVSEGDSPMTIKWIKDGFPISKDLQGVTVQELDEFSSILAIRTLTPKHNGNYTCVAKNLAGATSYTSALFVNASPKIIPFAFQDDQNFKGMRAHITCAVSHGDLPLEFQWLKDGQKISHALGATIGSYDRHSSSLSIENVVSKHSGNYTCVVTNEAGNASFTAQLMVQVAPKIVPFSFQGDHIFEGVLARVSCVVYQGDLPIAITWKKSNHDINSGHPQEGIVIQKVDDFTSILTIDHVHMNHSGNYTCIAKNSAAISTHTAQLLVKEEDLVEGMFVRASCVVSRGDLPLSISWTKDSRAISTDLGITTRQIDDYSSVLSIDHVVLQHSGNYTCTASNLAAITSFTSHLRVHVPPRWTTIPESIINSVAGVKLMLHCQAEGFPKPTITWLTRKDSSPSSPKQLIQNTDHQKILPNGTFVIQKTEITHEGFYFCRATNGIGQELSRITHLKIQVPPEIIEKSDTQFVPRGQKLTIHCQAKGDKPLSSSWLINGKAIIPNSPTSKYETKQTDDVSSRIKTQLTIFKVAKSDAATFTCQVGNKYGKNEANISVIVQGPPEAPTRVTVTSNSDKTVEVSWQTPSDGQSPITKYVIEYTTIKTGKPITHTATSTMNHVTLSNLIPSSIYTFAVFAENQMGRSEKGGKAEFTLAGQEPTGEPESVQVQAQNGKSLRVSWQNGALFYRNAKPPPLRSWNGNILGYYVGYRVTESQDPYNYRLLEVPEGYGKGLSYTISELKEFTSYSVVVQAFNEHGKGPLSNEVLVMTSEGVPNKAPLATECSPTSSQTITIQWQPPPHSSVQGILRGYRVLYWTSDTLDAEPLVAIFNTTHTKVTLRGLAKYSNYSIQILAYTLVGDGVVSKPIFCKTLEDTPGPPRDIKVLPSSTTSVLVAWLPPITPNGIITQYTIYIENVDAKHEKEIVHVVEGNMTAHEVHKLRKSQEYKFRVSAATYIGEGPSTLQVTASPDGPALAAKIAALDDTIRQSIKKSVVLPCPAAGMPTPKRNWYFRNQVLSINSRVSIQPSGSLKITSLHQADSGNYTCRVANDLGQDHVSYTVIVKVQPSTPTLLVSSTSFTAIDLQWKPPTQGPKSILGYVLHYKQELGSWQSIDIQPYLSSFQLGNLQCGTTHHMYLAAVNDIGRGQPSETVTATTTGGVPSVPPMEKLVKESTTHAVLHLDNWVTNGCPVLYYVVEYKSQASRSWSLVSNNLRPERESLILENLEPGTWYNLRMTAHTTAGSAIADYKFQTLDDSVDGKGDSNADEFYSVLNGKFLGSVLACVTVILLCISITCFWVTKSKRRPTSQSSKASQNRKSADHDNIDGADSDDEINPYATVKLSDFKDNPPQSCSGTPFRQAVGHNYNPTAPPMSESYSPFARGLTGANAALMFAAVHQGHHPLYAMPKKEMAKGLREAPTEEGGISNQPDLLPPPPEETLFVFPPAPVADERDGDYDPPPPELDWLPAKQ